MGMHAVIVVYAASCTLRMPWRIFLTISLTSLKSNQIPEALDLQVRPV